VPGSLVGDLILTAPTPPPPKEPDVLVLLGLHAVLAGLAPASGGAWGPGCSSCAPSPRGDGGLGGGSSGGVLDGPSRDRGAPWLGALDLELAFRLDGFALLMVALVSGIGVAVFAYAASYFAPRPGPRPLRRAADRVRRLDARPRAHRQPARALRLLGADVGDVVPAHRLRRHQGARPGGGPPGPAHHEAGGLAMLAGFVLLGQAAGTYTLSAILAAPPTGPTVGIAAALVLAGAFTKSAQVPFHSWLPGAMAAPTPVSAYLHSATMVKAGVYLIARFAPALAPIVGWWRPVVVGVGVLTMLVGGLTALRQHDVKLLLAHGTVSQLGFLVALFGAGWEEATFAGAALLLAHGLFKATLFMTVGIVDHAAHTRDLRRLSGLHATLRPVAVTAAVATASMAGLPPLLGFVAKEAGLEALLHEGSPGIAVLVGIVAGSALTAAYGARFVWGAFATKAGRAGAPSPATPSTGRGGPSSSPPSCSRWRRSPWAPCRRSPTRSSRRPPTRSTPRSRGST
jgi:multicomponent Na+:H+ antiporter subunit A